MLLWSAIDWVCLSVMVCAPALWFEPVWACASTRSVGRRRKQLLLRPLAGTHTHSPGPGGVRHQGRARPSENGFQPRHEQEHTMDELKAPRPLAVVTGASS